ncbi:MAG: UDP-N-acetylmuramoyl-tripeptide--D-alanyl-D-alanine ligase [Phycisphaerales bacterium JB063]
MTTFWTYDNLARITEGTWRVPPTDGSATLPAALNTDADDRHPVLWHDTRDLKPGQCYLAIQGENFDGHDFIEKAFEQGAALAIVNRKDAPQAHGFEGSGSDPKRRGIDAPAKPATRPILEVPDTVAALQGLARAYREVLGQGGCRVIGVAGSNGKTTTRHLIHHILTHAGKVGTQSPKSFNNHLGVPLTLLAARPSDDFVACEIGTNHPGEIDFLSAITRPDIAVITSIGEEHLEFFGDLEGVAEEEFSIIPHVVDRGHLVAGHLRNVIGHAGLQRLTGDRVSLHHFSDAANTPPRELSLNGLHNRVNAAMAGAVARLCDARFPDWYDALRSAAPPPHRCESIDFGTSVRVIDDCYNANPSSMMSALVMLGDEVRMRGVSRGVAILGDMFELGEQAVQCHGEVGAFAQDVDCEVSRLIAIGQYASTLADAFDPDRSVVFAQWSDDLPEQVAALLEPGDTVLLKASRGMRLERLIPAIEARFGKPAATADNHGLQ